MYHFPKGFKKRLWYWLTDRHRSRPVRRVLSPSSISCLLDINSRNKTWKDISLETNLALRVLCNTLINKGYKWECSQRCHRRTMFGFPKNLSELFHSNCEEHFKNPKNVLHYIESFVQWRFKGSINANKSFICKCVHDNCCA